MSGIHQVLFSTGAGGLGTVFLEPFRQISVIASSFGGLNAIAGVDIDLSSNGLISFNTFATGDFTEQIGDGNYAWLTGGSSTNYSFRYSTGPTFVSGLDTPGPQNVWLPISSGRVWTISRSAFDIGPLSDSVSFFIMLQIAATNNVSQILGSSQLNIELSATTRSGPPA